MAQINEIIESNHGFKIRVVENNLMATDGNALLVLSTKDYKDYCKKINDENIFPKKID